MAMSDYLWEEYFEDAKGEPEILKTESIEEFDAMLVSYLEWYLSQTLDVSQIYAVAGPVTFEGLALMGMEKYCIADLVLVRKKDEQIVVDSIRMVPVSSGDTVLEVKNASTVAKIFGAKNSPVYAIADLIRQALEQDDLAAYRKHLFYLEKSKKYAGFGEW